MGILAFLLRRPGGLLAILALTMLSGCDPDETQLPIVLATPAPAPLRHVVSGKIALEGREQSNGVLVYLGGTPLASRTDAQGAYAIRDVAPGTYELWAEKDGFGEAQIARIFLPDSGDPAVFQQNSFEMKVVAEDGDGTAVSASSTPAAAPGASLSGRVRIDDDEETPASGALARLRETNETVETDARGEFYFAGLRPGAYHLEVAMEGYETVFSALNVKDGQANQAETVVLRPAIEGQAGMSIVGMVEMYGVDGGPSAQFDLVTVELKELNRQTTLRPDGGFIFDNLPLRELLVSAVAKGYKLESTARIRVDPKKTPTVVLQMFAEEQAVEKTGGVVFGRARRSDDSGNSGGIAVALAGTQYVARTARDGSFRIEGVAATSYVLSAQAEGYDTLEVEDIVIGEEMQDIDVGDLVLEPTIIPPVVVETSPADGAKKVQVSRIVPISVRFSKPMDANSLKRAFSIDPGVEMKIYTGMSHANSRDDRLYIELGGAARSNYVKFDTTYKVRIATSATDMDGVGLVKPYSFDFRTAGPAVVDAHPKDGTEHVSLSPTNPVIFILNDQLKVRKFTKRYVTVSPRPYVTPRLETVINPESGWTEVRVFVAWEPNTRYSVTLKSGLENVDGKKFENAPYKVSFRTAEMKPVVPYFPGRERIRP